MNKIYNKQDLDIELAKTKKVLVLFYATWCPHCVRFVPFFNQKVAPLGLENIVHVILDDYDNPLWDEYGISAVPTVILFEEGKVCDRVDSQLGRGLSNEKFLKWLQDLK